MSVSLFTASVLWGFENWQHVPLRKRKAKAPEVMSASILPYRSPCNWKAGPRR